jgi:hypothetical protein
MKHPSLQHLPKKERWFRLQQFNGGTIGGTGLLLFIFTGGVSYFFTSIAVVSSGLSRVLREHGMGAIAAPLVAIPAFAAGALAWELYRRAAINRILDRSTTHRCPCGYDTTSLGSRCPECGREIP